MPLHVRTAPTTTTLCLGISQNEEWKDEAIIQRGLLLFSELVYIFQQFRLKLNQELSQFQSPCDLEFIPTLFESLTRLDWQVLLAALNLESSQKEALAEYNHNQQMIEILWPLRNRTVRSRVG